MWNNGVFDKLFFCKFFVEETGDKFCPAKFVVFLLVAHQLKVTINYDIFMKT